MKAYPGAPPLLFGGRPPLSLMEETTASTTLNAWCKWKERKECVIKKRCRKWRVQLQIVYRFMVRWLDIEMVGLVRVDFAWVRARWRKIVQSSPLLPPQLFLRLPKSFFRFKARDHHPEKSRNVGVCKLIQVALKIYVWCGRWLWFVCAKHSAFFFFGVAPCPKKREMKKKKSARARLKWLTRCYAAGQTLLSRHQLFELILERTFFWKECSYWGGTAPQKWPTPYMDE